MAAALRTCATEMKDRSSGIPATVVPLLDESTTLRGDD
jgi:hypothetical protein